MARNRKNNAAAIRFGPAVKVLFLCLLIAGSAVGYVWQKSQIYQLDKQIHEKETRLAQLVADNKKLDGLLAEKRSPVKLDQGARSLGLVPAQPGQVVTLPDMPSASPDHNSAGREFASRPSGITSP